MKRILTAATIFALSLGANAMAAVNIFFIILPFLCSYFF